MDQQQGALNEEGGLPTMPTIATIRLAELRAALADGWEIVQPIFARPLWSSVNDTRTAFNFVLRRERRVRLITVPHDRAVERFIDEQHLTVDNS
jgi:hypothetical protein